MQITKLKSKIHLVTVTQANKNYKGSLTLDKDLMQAARIEEGEQVHVNSKDTGKHWITYVIPGGKGEVCLNGAPANHFSVGEQVHIVCYALFRERAESWKWSANGIHSQTTPYEPIVVFCDENNNIISDE